MKDDGIDRSLPHYSEIVAWKSPNRTPRFLGKYNDYQYYKQRKDGWTFSVICNQAVMMEEQGLFEIAIWDNNVTGCIKFADGRSAHEIIVVCSSVGFGDVAKIEKQFDKDPEKLARKCLKRGY